MLRAIIIAASLFFAASASAQTASEVMGRDSIGPLKRGWVQADVLALGLPYTRNDSNIEGEPVTIYTVTTDHNSDASIWFSPDDIGFRLSTRSAGFFTEEGAHVGDTLAELQKLYPAGKVFIASEEGFQFAFFPWGLSGDGPVAAFRFDTDWITHACVEERRKCGDLNVRRATSFDTGW